MTRNIKKLLLISIALLLGAWMSLGVTHAQNTTYDFTSNGQPLTGNGGPDSYTSGGFMEHLQLMGSVMLSLECFTLTDY